MFPPTLVGTQAGEEEAQGLLGTREWPEPHQLLKTLALPRVWRVAETPELLLGSALGERESDLGACPCWEQNREGCVHKTKTPCGFERPPPPASSGRVLQASEKC